MTLLWTAIYCHPTLGDKTQTILASDYRKALENAENLLTGANGGELKGYFLLEVK